MLAGWLVGKSCTAVSLFRQKEDIFCMTFHVGHGLADMYIQ